MPNTPKPENIVKHKTMNLFKNFYAKHGYRVMEVTVIALVVLIVLTIYNAEKQRDINKKLQQNQEEVLKLLKR